MRLMSKICLAGYFILTGITFCFAETSNLNAAKEKNFLIAALGSEEPRIVGSACEFTGKSGTILRGDWVNKMWMKIDGRLVEFKGKEKPEEALSDADKKRWKQVFFSPDFTLAIDLIRIQVGEDGTAMKGVIKVQRGKNVKELKVKGGCSA